MNDQKSSADSVRISAAFAARLADLLGHVGGVVGASDGPTSREARALADELALIVRKHNGAAIRAQREADDAALVEALDACYSAVSSSDRSA